MSRSRTRGTHSVNEPARETGDPEIVLGLLTSIERDSAITQRKLAGDLGIALGLANSYLRRCVRKGLVKMSQAQPLCLLPDAARVRREKPPHGGIPVGVVQFFPPGARRLRAVAAPVQRVRLAPGGAVRRR